MSRRDRLASFATSSGLAALLEALPGRDCLLVVNYHRVGDRDATLFDRGVFSATAGEFDEQVAYLKSRFHIAELEEVQEMLADPAKFRHAHVLITFDDGYLDNYDIAFPILRSRGVQGTFFLPTSFVGTNRIPWWDQIAYLVRSCERDQLRIEYPCERVFSLTNGREDTIAELLETYKSPQTAQPERLLANVRGACGVTDPEGSAHRLFLNWTEAAEMLRCGMAVGSHTDSHELLAKQTPEQQLNQLTKSRQFIHHKLGHWVTSVAYPVGSRSAFNEETKVAARQAGYKVGFSFYGGVNLASRTDPFDVLRMGATFHTKPATFRFRVAFAGTTGMQIY